MRDATMDRLTKIIVDPQPSEGPGRNRRTPQVGDIFSHLRLAEGWFSFFLLALVVYSTIWCVQAVNWVDHLGLLTPITALGLLLGVVAAKQRRIPRVLLHGLAVVFGVLLALWQTSAVDDAGQVATFIANMRLWFSLAFSGGTSSDDSIFLFFILALAFLLAYTSAWLVYRTRSPWLMLLANAVVMLINLSYIDPGYIVFLVVFLVAALLLLLRFNLYESSMRWKRQGLRCSDDLHWEFMQAGALISLVVLVFSWLLPWGYTNQQASQIWSLNNNPWVGAQNLWNRLLAVNDAVIPQNHGSFASTLSLGGGPNLVNVPVFQVKSTAGSQQYLMSVSFDQYDGTRDWLSGTQVEAPVKASTPQSNGYADQQEVTQKVTVINPPGEQFPYLFGASQIASADQNVHLFINKSDYETVAWLRDNGKLAAGDVYTVVSDVSVASVQTLQSVPMPANAPEVTPGYDGVVPLTYFDPNTLHTYTTVPATLNPEIKALALQITRNAPTMYDKVTAIENYLRGNYTYDNTIKAPPAGVEATDWFLFQSKRGFCNYFASAMTLLARELGIPTRVAAGYTDGKFNARTGTWDINGTDAHAWTQVYFAGYGWINFEPSESFSVFTRPTFTTGPSSGPGDNGSNTNPISRSKGINDPNQQLSNSGGAGANDAAAAQVRTDVGIVLLVLIAFILGSLLYFNFWWRRLFRGLSLPSQIYGRVCVLAGWSGISTNRAQTPREYMQKLSVAAPEETVKFERLGDIYTRERWADPQSAEHPTQSGEANEMPGLWKSLQPRLISYVLRHPYFLRLASAELRHFTHRLFFRRAARRKSLIVVEEELK